MRKLTVLITALAVLGAALAPGAASAAGTMRQTGRTVSVDVTVDRFAVNRRGKVVAHATALTRVRTRDGRMSTAGDRVTLAVKTAASGCKVLDLSLQKLKLTLLGLTVDTSAVNVHITGDRTGSLGKLFCQLAGGLRLSNVTKTLRSVKAMNSRLRARPLHVMSFRTPMAQKAQSTAGASCRVLDLTLGPLNLDLLGLNVDLYGLKPTDPVVVTITADPNGGALGKLFCSLASNAGA
jgi:hypothetical protein